VSGPSRAAVLSALVWCSVASVARGNTEPSAFDARSVALGSTGVAWLDSPAAVVVNAANLTLQDQGALQLTFQPIFVKQWAPVEGPDTRSDSRGFGPMISGFASLRGGERWVLGAGIYTTTGFSSGFDAISAVAGEPLETPRDIWVRFFAMEGSLAAGFELHPRVSLGVGLRIPFAAQRSTVYQEIFPETGGWAWVSQELRGVGYPGGHFGLRAVLSDQVTAGFSYRTKVAIPMSGTTDVELSPDFVLEDIALKTTWYSPHAFQFGLAFTGYGERLLVAVDYRVQLHQEANRVQIFENAFTEDPLEAPFHFRNVHMLRLGAEMKVSERLALRLGISRGVSATSERGLQYFTPPPGISGSISGGLGLNLRYVDLDFATLYSHVGKYVQHDEERCGPGVTVKTGCGGEYGLRSIQLSVAVTRRFGTPRPQPAPFTERRTEERIERRTRRDERAERRAERGARRDERGG
jgi:long-subunit fatty acid transport protein